ncbi:MAG: DDE-type integrase/transposase/recombinase [Bacteroidota bacterium]
MAISCHRTGRQAMDLFSRRIVGWAMAPSLERTLVIKAFQMASITRDPSEGLIHHSDRGSQYASHDYQQLLLQKGIVGSMSRRGNCYDRAAAATPLPRVGLLP